MARKERMDLIKHIHLIQGNNLVMFLRLDDCWQKWKSFAVEGIHSQVQTCYMGRLLLRIQSWIEISDEPEQLVASEISWCG